MQSIMNNARILLVFVFACTMFYAGAQVPNEPKPEEPVAKKVHWYDNLQIRGYIQIRYNRLLETNEKLKCEQCDKSWGEDGGLFIRRMRVILYPEAIGDGIASVDRQQCVPPTILCTVQSIFSG